MRSSSASGGWPRSWPCTRWREGLQREGDGRPRRWSEEAEALLAALVSLLGRPGGKKGRSSAAFRQAARRLADHGVTPEALDPLLRDFALANLKTLGPMPLASFMDGRLKVADSRFVGCQQWAAECCVCVREVARGEMVWLRKGEGGKWLVTCSDCEEIDFAGERARSARAKALDRDGDPEALLAAILDHTPPEFREAVEDDLAMLVAVMAERS